MKIKHISFIELISLLCSAGTEVDGSVFQRVMLG